MLRAPQESCLHGRFKTQKLKYNSYLKGRVGWQNLRSEEFTDQGPYLVTGMHFKDGAVNWGECFHVTPDRYAMDRDIHVRVGDLLITKDGSIGKLAYIDALPGPACLNSHLLLIRPLSANAYVTRFLFYLLKGPEFLQFVNKEQTGTTFYGISQRSIENFPASFPPIEEQWVIVDFLDRETARIDELIAKKNRLVQLLDEEASAIIDHACTSPGFVALEPRWVNNRIGKVIKLQRGFDISGAGERVEGAPVYSSGGLSGFAERAAVKGPGVIVGRKGTLGTVHYSAEDYWPHDTTLWVREFKGNHPRYVYYFLKHMRLARFDIGAANPTLNRNHVHPLAVDWPNVEYQIASANYLDTFGRKADQIKEKVIEAVEKLHEYRTTLISAAVSGELDVHNYHKEPEAVLEAT